MPRERRPTLAHVADGAKQILREGLRRAGLTVHRYSAATVPDAQIQALLAHHQIDLVLDVGANAGQYAISLRRAGYRGRILSFEPLQEAWERCAANASTDALWSVAPRMALGATERQVKIHVANNSVSSSILPMREIHRRAAPDSSYVGTQSVDMRRLDRVAREAIGEARRPFLKIDTQGYEREVLEGASDVLNRLRGIQLEISLTPLYEGSPTLTELLQMMERWGYAAHALLPGFTDLDSGRMFQVDGLFFSNSTLSAPPSPPD
jgi:FkbM family methyltransferase